jgi:hypothetical protein
MLEYYRMVREKNIDIIFSGPMWADGIEGIADVLKKRLDFDELPLNLSQSVFSVFVEQVNNMLMYSGDREHPGASRRGHEAPSGAFILGTLGKMYFIQSGNIMKTSGVDTLRSRIDHLNTLDKAGLRKYYREQIRAENTNPESKGAGLGFIEIARRANPPIEYEFTPLDGGTTFFSMYVTIGQEE